MTCTGLQVAVRLVVFFPQLVLVDIKSGDIIILVETKSSNSSFSFFGGVTGDVLILKVQR